jgi:hypothetical protein
MYPGRRYLASMALLLSACMMGCSAGSPVGVIGDSVSGDGVVRYYSIEGGFYAIRGLDDRTYDPVNLPAEFRVDSLPVRFTGRILRDAFGFHMGGPIIELTHVERRQ